MTVGSVAIVLKWLLLFSGFLPGDQEANGQVGSFGPSPPPVVSKQIITMPQRLLGSQVRVRREVGVGRESGITSAVVAVLQHIPMETYPTGRGAGNWGPPLPPALAQEFWELEAHRLQRGLVAHPCTRPWFDFRILSFERVPPIILGLVALISALNLGLPPFSKDL